MGVGAYACYKLTTLFPDVNILVWIVVSGFVLQRGRRAVRPAEPAHQGLLPGGGDAGRAVLPAMVLRRACPGSTTTTPPGAIEVPHAHRCSACRSPARTRRRRRAISSCSTVVAVLTLDRLEHRARPHRAHVDGGARHGHRRRADRHPAAAAPSCSPSPSPRSTAASPAR